MEETTILYRPVGKDERDQIDEHLVGRVAHARDRERLRHRMAE